MYNKEKKILIFILGFLLIYYLLQKNKKLTQLDNSLVLLVLLILLNIFHQCYRKTKENFKNNIKKLIKFPPVEVELYTSDSDNTSGDSDNTSGDSDNTSGDSETTENTLDLKKLKLMNNNMLDTNDWDNINYTDRMIQEYELGLKNSINDDDYYKLLLEQKKNTLSKKENSIFNFDIFNIFKKKNDTTDALLASVFDDVDDDGDNNDYNDIYSKIKNSTFDSSDTSNAISENNEAELPDKTNTGFKHYKYSKTLLKETEDTEDTEDTKDTKDTETDSEVKTESKVKTESEVNKISNIFNNIFKNLFN
jgi:hypothetical protein